MPQTKILLDSCSYFRLAQNIHPLLAISFGQSDYTLYVHSALIAEFSRDARLQTKFDWVMRKEYVANRSQALQLGRKEAKAIETTFEYIWEHVKAERLGPSPTDVRILASAAELNLRIVTDDRDLIGLANMYGVHATTSLELMQLMLDSGHIQKDKVRQVVAQWAFDRDVPANFVADYRRLFSEEPPKE